MEVRKEIIRAGKHVYIDDKGKPQVLDVTPATIDHYHDDGVKMLSHGISIPVPLEHQPTATAMTPEEKAANTVLHNAGEVKRYEKGMVKDENAKDIPALFGILNITKPEAAEGIKQGSIRWASPWVNSFTDGEGRKWNGVISHVALTTRPRIARQQPFIEANAALSLAPKAKPLDVATVTQEGFALSRAGLLKKVGKKYKPVAPIAFSLFAGVKFSEEEMEDMEENDEIPGDYEAEGSEPPKKEGTEEETGMGVPEALDDQDGDSHLEEVIFHLLDCMGIPVPPHPGKSFVRNLYESLMRGVKEMAKEPEESIDMETDVDTAAKEPMNPIVEESPAMQMSLADRIKRVEDPILKSAMLSMQNELDAERNKRKGADAERLEAAKKHRQARIDRLLKSKVPHDQRSAVAAEFSLPGVQMSLGLEGQIIDPMETALRVLEKAADLPALLRESSGAFSVQSPPSDGTMTAERREEIMKTVLGNTGGIPHQAVAAAK
jgi:hypothetical protein